MRPAIFSVALLAILSGCVQPGLYKWGGYDQKLYASYKDPTQVENLRIALETHIAEMENTGQKVAPGLYAEVGTIYLQMGDSIKAASWYGKERDAWPESRGLMMTMLQNLERRQKAKQLEAMK